MTLRLGTRGSALALAQAGMIADAIRDRLGRDVELVEIVTPGDRSGAPIAQLGVGVFVSALRDALVAKEIDVAVHSYKDLPTAPADGLVIAAVPPREDARDALVAPDARTLNELRAGARIGTAAPRRIAQLHALGRQLVPVPVRGNVDTRLRKLADGEFDAIVLARAGLLRLGRAGFGDAASLARSPQGRGLGTEVAVTEVLDPMLMLPAPAQGALAVECREDDCELRDLLGGLDDPMSRVAITAERAMLTELEAGCSAPIGALAEVAEGDHGLEIYLRGGVFSVDGQFAVRLSRTGTLADAAEVGRALAADLRERGADTALGVQHDPHA